MSGSVIGNTSAHDRLGRFTTGNTEYRAKRLRIDALSASLADAYDARTDAARALLRVAAEHLDDSPRARSRVLKARSTRAAAKILALLPRLPAPPPPTLEELLNG